MALICSYGRGWNRQLCLGKNLDSLEWSTEIFPFVWFCISYKVYNQYYGKELIPHPSHWNRKLHGQSGLYNDIFPTQNHTDMDSKVSCQAGIDLTLHSMWALYLRSTWTSLLSTLDYRPEPTGLNYNNPWLFTWSMKVIFHLDCMYVQCVAVWMHHCICELSSTWLQPWNTYASWWSR